VERLQAFKSILSEEINEIDEIIEAAQKQAPAIEVLTMLADLLGDIQVYCASEMAKFGLPLDEVLAIIMQSNFSKLGADGKPIYDERGKVQKGPDYWKPEPKIQACLQAKTAPEKS
jgi:predicted HAD superfamily Cof-like phosphohydrolase